MQITQLSIRNFKSIRDLEIRHIENALILVGKNNTGKTGVLKAIRAALGSYCVSETDFNEKNQNIEISMTLSITQEDLQILHAQGAVSQYQKLDHVAGAVPEPFHRQQVMPGDGQMEGLHFRLLSLISSTAGPYRATRRALTIRLNARVSTTSLLARSARATPDPSA